MSGRSTDGLLFVPATETRSVKDQPLTSYTGTGRECRLHVISSLLKRAAFDLSTAPPSIIRGAALRMGLRALSFRAASSSCAEYKYGRRSAEDD